MIATRVKNITYSEKSIFCMGFSCTNFEASFQLEPGKVESTLKIEVLRIISRLPNWVPGYPELFSAKISLAKSQHENIDKVISGMYLAFVAKKFIFNVNFAK